MRNRDYYLIALLLFSFLFASPSSQANPKKIQLETCLLECYGVDVVASAQILEKFSPLLEDQEYTPVVNAFLEESKKLNIYLGSPLKQSADIAPPFYHWTLFENEYIRISWAVTRSGEQEPPQRHPWKSLMVVIRSSQFYSQLEDGTSYEDHWPIGVYLLDPSSDLLSCKNIGSEEFNGLIFEIK